MTIGNYHWAALLGKQHRQTTYGKFNWRNIAVSLIEWGFMT